MSALEKIAYYQNRRDEMPNQELAHQLAQSEDATGIREMADNLWHKNKNIRSDCLKVLYEIGYLKPALIAPYAGEFLKLLKDRENRMVWGAMIALATMADQRADEIWQKIEDVLTAVENGTLITFVWGLKALALVARADPLYCEKLFPILLGHLRTCNPRDLPLHAGSVLPAVNPGNQAEYLAVVLPRQCELTAGQLSRMKKVLKSQSFLEVRKP